MDVIKYFFFFLLLCSLPGKAQVDPSRQKVSLPDTILSPENTIFLIEEKTSVYFSYNTDILDSDLPVEWKSGNYTLEEILERICQLQGILYTVIGNQVVFYEKGKMPPLPSGEQKVKTFVPRQIRGRILGLPTNEALSYATVWLPSTWEGTIANMEGFFILNLPPSGMGDTIAISCMGYKIKNIHFSELADSMNTIYLHPSIIPIQEVVIRRTDPLHLIREALKRIPQNNSSEPVIETAFYRETIQKNDKYMAVSEAVIDIYKPGFESRSTEQVRVLRGRKNNDFSATDTVLVKLKAGLETSFLLDIIRNRPDFLQEDLFHKFEYQMSDIVVIQDKSTYAIDFHQKESTKPPHYQGRIYIDLENLAFRGLEFEVNPETINSAANSMVLKKPRKLKVRPLSASYIVKYKSENGKYYLSMIRTDNHFKIRQRKKLFGNEFRAVSEMAVTGLKTGSLNRFPLREAANTGDIFSDMLGGYDQSFWGPYNYLIPEESLEDALIRISRLMEESD
ncbi:carboxypeptidase-like regulatory domain-containing protein [Bacteroidota bacterium]